MGIEFVVIGASRSGRASVLIVIGGLMCRRGVGGSFSVKNCGNVAVNGSRKARLYVVSFLR